MVWLDSPGAPGCTIGGAPATSALRHAAPPRATSATAKSCKATAKSCKERKEKDTALKTCKGYTIVGLLTYAVETYVSDW